MALTVEQREKLMKAIDLAEGPGECTYVRDGRPCCVVAQLGAMEGIPLDTMAEWDRGGTRVGLILYAEKPGAQELRPYGRELLGAIQELWDGADETDITPEPEKRAKMREIVAAA